MEGYTNSDAKIQRVLIFTLHSQQALHVIRALSSVGIKCYVVGHDRFAMHLFSKHCHVGFFTKRKFLEEGDDQFFQKVNSFVRKKKIDVLIGTDGDTTRMLIKCRNQLKGARVYPGPDLNLFDKLHDKWNFAELLNQFNLPQPEYQLISKVEDFDLKKLGFPVLLKPLIGAGSIGIQKIDNFSAFKSAIQELKNKNRLPILAQEYIDGQDIDYNVLSEDGNIIAWSIQQRINSQKGLIRYLVNEDVAAICRELIQRSKYTGVGHIDLRIDDKDGRVKFIEFNPRFWGSLDYSTAMGLNFPYLGIQIFTKQSIIPSLPVVGDCPYLPISLAALVRKITGRGISIKQGSLKKWAQYLWADPLPELIEDIRRRFRKT
ncbi:MAG: hypothetical protein CVV44_05545 [Spirochaetae bacterium HGW-Spirochaetae-1]|jgi:predicted ATP-grasp superfamily ATP-dependent carboligase|nr:MAG: hypothetical protein CVV44_05545 [Spirochaetae bacterium HGW-Spirochaetae-1]